MAKQTVKVLRLARRKKHVRTKVSGTPAIPRLTVFRSLRHIYAQLVDDTSGRTLACASSVALKVRGSNVEGAKVVGKALAEKAREAAIETVRFDRNGRVYHGRVQALADSAREAGLNF
jgi:large subunit ribosomal protein L18